MSIKIKIHEEDAKGNVYELMFPPVRYAGLVVPVGFRSDGASVPRFFWRLVFPPGDTHALKAAFVHDYIYRTHPEGWSRVRADKVFLALLIEGGVPIPRALLAYMGVRLFGRRSWKEGVKKK